VSLAPCGPSIVGPFGPSVGSTLGSCGPSLSPFGPSFSPSGANNRAIAAAAVLTSS
jgi:hypothetical protein